MKNRIWEVHYLLENECNLNCEFCFWSKRYKDIPVVKKRLIVDQIIESGIKKITISGGEPLLNKDLITVLKYIHQNKLESVIHTNGLKLTKSKIQEIKGFVNRISLSIPSIKEWQHNLQVIENLNKENIKVSVKTLVSKENQNEVVLIGQNLSKMQIEYWSLLEFKPIDRGLFKKNKFYLKKIEFRKIVRECKNKFPNMKIRTRSLASQIEKYCFIAANGDVYKNSRKEDIRIGNVFETKLKKLIELIEKSGSS